MRWRRPDPPVGRGLRWSWGHRPGNPLAFPSCPPARDARHAHPHLVAGTGNGGIETSELVTKEASGSGVGDHTHPHLVGDEDHPSVGASDGVDELVNAGPQPIAPAGLVVPGADLVEDAGDPHPQAVHEHRARIVVEQHGGVLPDDLDALLALPGVGEYTAGAVLAFAHGRRALVLDTNVRRVLARAVGGQALPAPSLNRAERERALGLLPDDDATAAHWSVAVMELGALVCTASAPDCGACPVSRCAWVAAGKPEPNPEEQRKKKTQRFAGTDRQVRGKIMRVLRGASAPVPQRDIDVVWPDAAQRSRALFSLLEDGLAVQDDAGYFHLPR